MSTPAKDEEKVPPTTEGTTPTILEQVEKAAAQSAKRKKKKKKKAKEISVQILDNIEADVQVDLEAAKANATEFNKGRLNEHKFWKDQPVPQFTADLEAKNEPIQQSIPVDQVQKEPYPLNKVLEWCTLDINNPAEMDELYDLLNKNYVEDSSCSFRFDYSREFLRWALTPPGWLPQWHLAIRGKDKKKLLAFISAIPATLRSYNKSIPLVEINFLCVHKQLRDKRLAPVLIQEITRQVHLTNRWQAVYTAGKLLPRPVAVCRYYHRSLNPVKLVDVGFSYQGERTTKAMMVKLYRLPATTSTPGIRPMVAKDCHAVHTLLTNYFLKFKIAPVFSEEEVRHFLVPRDGVIYSYVVEDATTKKVTDFISYYCLPSTIVDHPKHSLLKAAYSFYNVPNVYPLKSLMQDALVLAKQNDFDVFNALDLMENSSFLEELKFGIGDGKLRYYLYNWDVPTISPKDLGLVLT